MTRSRLWLLLGVLSAALALSAWAEEKPVIKSIRSRCALPAEKCCDAACPVLECSECCEATAAKAKCECKECGCCKTCADPKAKCVCKECKGKCCAGCCKDKTSSSCDSAKDGCCATAKPAGCCAAVKEKCCAEGQCCSSSKQTASCCGQDKAASCCAGAKACGCAAAKSSCCCAPASAKCCATSTCCCSAQHSACGCSDASHKQVVKLLKSIRHLMVEAAQSAQVVEIPVPVHVGPPPHMTQLGFPMIPPSAQPNMVFNFPVPPQPVTAPQPPSYPYLAPPPATVPVPTPPCPASVQPPRPQVTSSCPVSPAVARTVTAMAEATQTHQTPTPTIPARILSIEEIVGKCHQKVADHLIIDQIRKSGSVYHLAPCDVHRLKDKGVSQAVIEVMASTCQPKPPMRATQICTPSGYMAPPCEGPVCIGVSFDPVVRTQAQPRAGHWDLRVVQEDGKAQLEVKERGQCLTCEKMALKVPGGSCIKVCVSDCGKQVWVKGCGLQASADEVAQHGDCLLLAGHIKLTYAKDGQQAEMAGDRIMVGLTTGRLELQPCPK